jgi:hemerythrin-like domain-containing protein
MRQKSMPAGDTDQTVLLLWNKKRAALGNQRADACHGKRRFTVKCTDLLRDDHKIILRALDVLQCIVKEGAPERIDQNDTMTLLRFLRVFADEHHHMKEEGVLFPEVMRVTQTEAGPLRHLLLEHSQERALVGELEDAVRSTQTAEFVLFANQLTERVRDHLQKEDGILFPILDLLISSELDKKVRVDFKKFPLDFSLMSDLQRLELKYLRKTVQ